MDVRPFRGITYNSKDLGTKITEPYDKISKEMQEAYYRKDPYNFIRINLPNDKDPYTSSKNTINTWLSTGVLKKEEKPTFYHYIQSFELNGRTYARNGFFAIVKLEKYESKNILPHERTFKGPKEDRLKMLRSTNMDLEPVFLLYDDPDMYLMNIFKTSDNEEIADVVDENGVRHQLIKIFSPKIGEFFEGKKMVIADGHHRYETALTYAEEMGRRKGTGYIMAVLVNRHDPGLIILPSHRIFEKSEIEPEKLLEEMKTYFNIQEINPKSVKGFMENEITFCYRNHSYTMELKPEYMSNLSLSEKLNVSILNNFVISKLLKLDSKESIKYARWPEEVWSLLNENKAKFAFILKPIKPSTVWDVALQGEVMPQKSTDFYPKLISGLEMFDLNDEV